MKASSETGVPFLALVAGSEVGGMGGGAGKGGEGRRRGVGNLA